MILRIDKFSFIHPQSIGFIMEQHKAIERIYADGLVVPYIIKQRMTYIDFTTGMQHIDEIKRIGGETCG